MIKYVPPIYPVDLALVTLKEALDQIHRSTLNLPD